MESPLSPQFRIYTNEVILESFCLKKNNSGSELAMPESPTTWLKD